MQKHDYFSADEENMEVTLRELKLQGFFPVSRFCEGPVLSQLCSPDVSGWLQHDAWILKEVINPSLFKGTQLSVTEDTNPEQPWTAAEEDGC